jgi:hypothetical protein
MIEQMFRDGEEVYLNNNSDGIDIEKLTNNMVDAIIKIGVEDSEDSRI